MYESAVKGIPLEHMFADRRQIAGPAQADAGRPSAHDAMSAGLDGAWQTTLPGVRRAVWPRIAWEVSHRDRPSWSQLCG
jgi:hypothetical protein